MLFSSFCFTFPLFCHRTWWLGKKIGNAALFIKTKVVPIKTVTLARPHTNTMVRFEFLSVWSDKGNLDNCMIDSLVFFLHFTEQALFRNWRGREILRCKMLEPAETWMWAECTLKCTHTHTHTPTNYFWSVVLRIVECVCASMSQLTLSLPFVSLPLPPQKAKEDHIKWGCCCVAVFGWVLREIWGKALL